MAGSFVFPSTHLPPEVPQGSTRVVGNPQSAGQAASSKGGWVQRGGRWGYERQNLEVGDACPHTTAPRCSWVGSGLRLSTQIVTPAATVLLRLLLVVRGIGTRCGGCW